MRGSRWGAESVPVRGHRSHVSSHTSNRCAPPRGVLVGERDQLTDAAHTGELPPSDKNAGWTVLATAPSGAAGNPKPSHAALLQEHTHSTRVRLRRVHHPACSLAVRQSVTELGAFFRRRCRLRFDAREKLRGSHPLTSRARSSPGRNLSPSLRSGEQHATGRSSTRWEVVSSADVAS